SGQWPLAAARSRQRANNPLTIRKSHWKSVSVLPTFAGNPIGADPGSGRSAPVRWRDRALLDSSRASGMDEVIKAKRQQQNAGS
ncbi:hypothetical protein ABTF54_19925, partial [Acinetobacter baumannii]